MTTVSDRLTTGAKEPSGTHETYLTAGAVTKGYAVSLASAGTITASATADLSSVIGVAAETAASGELCKVLVRGFCDYVVTDGLVAATDLVLHVINGGTCSGATEAEITADPTLGYHVFAKNLLAADSGTTGTCYVNAGAGGSGGATS